MESYKIFCLKIFLGLLLSKKLIRAPVSWSGYVLEVEKQLSDPEVYEDVTNSEKIQATLSEASKKMLSSLRRKGFITEKQIKCFTY